MGELPRAEAGRCLRQAVVFYDGDEVLGGGIIAKVNPEAPPQKILG